MTMDRNSDILKKRADKTVKGLRRSHSAYCLRCEKIVELFTFEEAAECFNTDERDIEFLANRLMLHRIHNKKGLVMICTSRFSNALKREQRACSIPRYLQKVPLSKKRPSLKARPRFFFVSIIPLLCTAGVKWPDSDTRQIPYRPLLGLLHP